jgi:hypothetical protein
MIDSVYLTNSQSSSWAAKDYLSIFALVISIFSLVASFYNVHLNKKVEISIAKFNKLCIEYIGQQFIPIEKIFDEKPNRVLALYRNDITIFSTNLQSYLLQLKQANYPSIKIQEFIDALEKFTDKIYDQPSITEVYELRGDYFEMKLKVHELLYQFAIENELKLYLMVYNFFGSINKKQVLT